MNELCVPAYQSHYHSGTDLKVIISPGRQPLLTLLVTDSGFSRVGLLVADSGFSRICSTMRLRSVLLC